MSTLSLLRIKSKYETLISYGTAKKATKFCFVLILYNTFLLLYTGIFLTYQLY